MEISIITNFDVEKTHWHSALLSEGHETIVLRNQGEKRWSIELPKNHLKSMKKLIDETLFEVRIVETESITIHAMLEFNPKIRLKSTSQIYLDSILEHFAPLTQDLYTRICDENDALKGIQYGGGVDINLVNSLASICESVIGFSPSTELKWSGDDTDVYFHLPIRDDFDPFSGHEILFDVFTDCDELVDKIMTDESELSFLNLGEVEFMEHDIWATNQQFEISGPVGMENNQIISEKIELLRNYLHDELKVDKETNSLEFNTNSKLQSIQVHLPINQYRDQLLPANVGEMNNRYMVHLESTSDDYLESMKSQLLDLGYLVHVESGSTLEVSYQTQSGEKYGSSFEDFEKLREQFGSQGESMVIADWEQLHSNAIKLTLPLGKFKPLRGSLTIHNLEIRYNHEGMSEKVRSRLKGIRYNQLELSENRRRRRYEITYGIMPLRGLRFIDRLMREIFEIHEA